MTDIAERLRNFCVWNSRHSHYDPVPVCKEGADEIDRLRAALTECVEVLALVEHPRRKDPDYGAEVAALGNRIGYGALMSSAQASWRETLKQDGYPVGGEFVAGPCYATVLNALKMARAALPSSDRGSQ